MNKTYQEHRAQLIKEAAINSDHPRMVWDMRQHRSWGNSIQWSDWGARRLVGWTRPIPREGDELRAEMESGRIGMFEFLTVEPQVDPSDMWFGTVKDLGYEEKA